MILIWHNLTSIMDTALSVLYKEKSDSREINDLCQKVYIFSNLMTIFANLL